MVNSWERARSSGCYQPKPRRQWRSGEAGGHFSGGVLTFLERGGADFPGALQVAAQSAHIGPGDLVRDAVEMLGTQGSETGQDRVDLGFARNKGCNSG